MSRTRMPACIIAFLAAMIFAMPVTAGSGPRTHLLAVGICPPWKSGGRVSPACANNVAAIKQVVGSALGTAEADIHTLLNAAATYDGLDRAFDKMAGRAGPGDRVILYFSVHGGALHQLADYRSELRRSGTFAPLHDTGVLMLWTEAQPFTTLSALAAKQWIAGSDLARMIDRIEAAELIVVLDSCNAAIEFDAFASVVGAKSTQRRAVVASALSWQFANFDRSGSMALFTSNLAPAIATGSSSFARAVDAAARKTRADAEALCPESATVRSIEKLYGAGRQAARRICEQTPVARDPHGLLRAITLNQ